jgi:hypothetical protein
VTKPCKNGHVDRYPNGRCRTCANLRAAAWAENNPDRARANWASSHARPEAKEVQAAYYLENREVAIARATKTNTENPERRLSYNRAWVAKNRDKRAMYNVARRAAVQVATPAWADHAQIATFYAEAQRKTVETGVRYSVDHVVPLKGKRVCGLHVQFNLAVIPYVENCRKGASYGPE